MTKRRLRVYVDSIVRNGQAAFMRVHADEDDFDLIQRVEGIDSCYVISKSALAVCTDPRYDADEVINEIMAINNLQTVDELLEGAIKDEEFISGDQE
jgi:hypothetical protein